MEAFVRGREYEWRNWKRTRKEEEKIRGEVDEMMMRRKNHGRGRMEEKEEGKKNGERDLKEKVVGKYPEEVPGERMWRKGGKKP